MHYRDKSYAVEVTTLLESIPLGGEDPRPLPQSLDIHRRLVASVEREAIAAGILDGAYSVCFGVSIAGRTDLQDRIISVLSASLRSGQRPSPAGR